MFHTLFIVDKREGGLIFCKCLGSACVDQHNIVTRVNPLWNNTVGIHIYPRLSIWVLVRVIIILWIKDRNPYSRVRLKYDQSWDMSDQSIQHIMKRSRFISKSKSPTKIIRKHPLNKRLKKDNLSRNIDKKARHAHRREFSWIDTCFIISYSLSVGDNCYKQGICELRRGTLESWAHLARWLYQTQTKTVFFMKTVHAKWWVGVHAKWWVGE